MIGAEQPANLKGQPAKDPLPLARLHLKIL